MHTNFATSSINKWYQKPIGKLFLEYEIKGLKSILSNKFGYYIVQIGGPTNQNVLLNSRINNQIIVGCDANFRQTPYEMICDPTALSFIPESIDVLVVFHIFEFYTQKEQILKELYNAIIPGGYLISFNFNPFSLWGLKYFQNNQNKTTPWNGTWNRPTYLKKLFLKTGFSIYEYQTFCFQFPINSDKQILFLETIGNLLWSDFGASYMLVGKKTTASLIPLKSLRQGIITKTIRVSPKPASRIMQ